MRSHVDYLLDVSGRIRPDTRARKNAYKRKHSISSLCLLAERRVHPVGLKLRGGYLSPGTQPQLLEDLAHVVCDRVLGDGEHLGDPAVGQSPLDQERHLLLAGSEFL